MRTIIMRFMKVCFYLSLISLSCTLTEVNGCLDCGGEDPVVTDKKDGELPLDPESYAKPTEVDDNVADVEPETDENSSENIPESPRLKEYKKYFILHRAKQLEAVKGISLLKNDEQRHNLMSLMLKQLFVTLGDAKENLTVAGYLPGDPFPEDEDVKESMSKILENTALFGDLILFMPDIVHSMYDKEKEWQILLAWSYGFSTQSGVYEGNYKTMLTLGAMEANIIPKGKDFINPFKSLAKIQSLMDDAQKDPKKNKTKKPKKKIERGPKLRKTEL
uniref:Coiled-coil domain-containing protein n=1 Tax=Biomphalaria glabrata TaxID=6526 RepID=A0A2C9LQ58_BIOGL